MARLYNLGRVTTATEGTGTITLGGAVPGFQTFADAGVSNGDVVAYAIRDGVHSEIGYGTYASSGTTLTRNVRKSTNGNTAISLSGNAEVVITPSAEDLTEPGVSPMTFGAVGDGVTDDTAAVQAAFDHAVDNDVPIYGYGKRYLIDNLSIKNRSNGANWMPVLRAYGGGAHLIKRSSADNSYLIAPQLWIANTAAATQYPVVFDRWVMNGNSIATSVFVDVYFGHYITYNEVFGGTSYGVYQPTTTMNGSTNITNTRCCAYYIGNRIRNNGSRGFVNEDTASTSFISDMSLIENDIFDNVKNLHLEQTAGWFIYGNRVYGHTDTAEGEGAFIEEGFACLQGNTWGNSIDGDYCLRVRAETFPLRIFGDNFQTEHASALGLNCDFGTAARIIQVEGCRFESEDGASGACGITHSGNSANNEVISKNNVFDIASPYTFSGGASHAGIIRVVDDRGDNVDPAVVTPSQITADQNDYTPSGLQYANVLRLSSDATRSITGLGKGYFGRRIWLANVGGQTINLITASGLSAAANQFTMKADIVLSGGDAKEFWYDGTSSRWRPVDDVSSVMLANTGLRIKDTDSSHALTIAPGSNLTDNRTLTVTTGDADRTLDISAGSVTISAAGAELIDDANAAAQRTTLGVGTGDSPTFTAITLSGGQVAFPASQNASADANTLDDYEEGVWTPTITFATAGDLSVAYSSQTGTYTKIGRVVHVIFAIVTSSFTHTTASGNLRIPTLPFAGGSGGLDRGALQWAGITKANYTQINMRATSGQTYMEAFACGSGQAVSAVSTADMPTGGSVILAGTLTYTV